MKATTSRACDPLFITVTFALFNPLHPQALFLALAENSGNVEQSPAGSSLD